MKKAILSALYAMICVLGYAQTTTQIQLSHTKVVTYLKKHLNDDKGYKSVSWGKLEKIPDTLKSYHYAIEHTFRAKNSYNATILNTWTFILDRKLNVIEVETESLEDQANDLLEQQKKVLQDIQDLKDKN